MAIYPCLWFEKDVEAAIERYVSLIPNSHSEWTGSMPADSPSGPPGSVRIINFTLDGTRFQAMQAGPYDPFNHAISIVFECETQDQLDRIWDGLIEGGKTEQCGWLRDRWGLSWQIVPKRLGELMASADPAAGKRVAEAMMKMVKMDIATLERAATGEGQ